MPWDHAKMSYSAKWCANKEIVHKSGLKVSRVYPFRTPRRDIQTVFSLLSKRKVQNSVEYVFQMDLFSPFSQNIEK